MELGHCAGKGEEWAVEMSAGRACGRLAEGSKVVWSYGRRWCQA